jgi:16S rRNA (cytosine1402-N4)-methyltransferase
VKKELRGSSTHVPVLLDPVIAGLNLHEDGLYIDGTFGRGGHSLAILNRLGDTGRLLAIDRDPQAIDAAADALKNDPRFELIKGEFSELKEHAIKRNLLGKVDGLLLDLGVSSPQLDEAERGFSFQSDGPLDMRMDPTSGSSAADWLATVKERDLRKVLFEFGEERFAVRIARAIVAARAVQPIRRTAELAKIVSEAVPSRGQKRHPATKTFQAIRIRINDELQQLEQGLRASTDLLRPGGRLCVISFHSLEDRRVKRFMRDASREAAPYRGLPEIPEEHRPPFKLIGKMISATDEEIELNVRSRSARLRVAERL